MRSVSLSRSQLLWPSILATVLVAALACTPAAPPAAQQPKPAAPPAQPAAPKQEPAAPAQADWEVEWEQTLEAARQEGSVSVYGPAGDVIRRDMVEAFESAFPGITLEWSGGRNTDMAVKMEADRRAGINNVDVFLGGTSTALKLVRPTGAVAPIKPALILPEVTDSQNWLGGALEFADSEELNLVYVSVPSTVVMFNRTIVSEEEVNSLEELLDPKWQGQIVINDPVPTGAGNVAFRLFWEALGPEEGERFIRALRAQAGAVSRDQRQQIEWVARGQYPILIGASGITLEQLEPIRDRMGTITQLEEIGGLITASSGSVIMIDNPPNPNAAKVYVNWLLSQEGQTVWSRALGQPSRRVDVPRDHLPDYAVVEPDGKYWLSYTEEGIEVSPEWEALINELFAS